MVLHRSVRQGRGVEPRCASVRAWGDGNTHTFLAQVQRRMALLENSLVVFTPKFKEMYSLIQQLLHF